MSTNGYIKLHRKILEWEWIDHPATLTVWLHLLLRAQWQDTPKEYKGAKLKRGQCIIGRKELAAATGLSEQQIRTALANLQTTSNITTKPTNKYTIVTIENYTKYQEKTKTATSNPTNKTADEQPLKKNKRIKNKEYLYIDPAKKPFGVKENVLLTDSEYDHIISTYENAKELIDSVSLWLTEHERKDHHATCLTFARNGKYAKKQKPIPKPKELTKAEKIEADIARDELMRLIDEKRIGGNI